MNKRPEILNGIIIPYDASLSDIEKMLNKPGDEAWAALHALTKHSSLESFNLLKSYTKSSDWRFRRTAIEVLTKHPRANQAIELFIDALSDQSEYVVRTACDSVSALKIKTAHEHIVQLLKSNNDNTRKCAVQVIAYLWTSKDFPLVYSLFTSDPNEKNRREAAWTLRKIASAKTWQTLFNAWKNETLPRHRLWACELAYKYGTIDCRNDLKILSKDIDGHVRKAAAKALLILNEK